MNSVRQSQSLTLLQSWQCAFSRLSLSYLRFIDLLLCFQR